MTVPLRLLIDPPLDGPTNMARDEALLDAAAAGECATTLRCYRWSEPTVSLGYFQPYAEFESCSAAREYPVVRRTTGGGAILHDRELTYCLAVLSRHPLLSDGATSLYCRMHDAIIAVVRELGVQAERRGSVLPDDADRDQPFFCFERAHALDVVVGERKLAGSAQRRTPNAVLQHGSIILDAVHDESATRRAGGAPSFSSGRGTRALEEGGGRNGPRTDPRGAIPSPTLRSPSRPAKESEGWGTPPIARSTCPAPDHDEQPSAAVQAHGRIDPDELARRIAKRFATDNDLSLTPSVWQPTELDRANYHAARYNSATWTRRR